jgi:hypothetical protein
MACCWPGGLGLAIGLFKSDGREAPLVWTLEVAQIDGRTGSVLTTQSVALTLRRE